MSDNRPTQTLQTASGKEVVLKTYLNARERNVVRNSFLEGVKLNAADLTDPEALKNASIQVSAAQITEASEKALLGQVVVSYDGSAETILDRLLDGTPEDYDFVVAEANKIGNFQRAK